MSWFTDWKSTRHVMADDDISSEEFNMLYRSVRRSNSARRVLSVAWQALLGICAIVAAVFSVLSYLQ